MLLSILLLLLSIVPLFSSRDFIIFIFFFEDVLVMVNLDKFDCGEVILLFRVFKVFCLLTLLTKLK